MVQSTGETAGGNMYAPDVDNDDDYEVRWQVPCTNERGLSHSSDYKTGGARDAIVGTQPIPGVMKAPGVCLLQRRAIRLWMLSDRRAAAIRIWQ